MDDTGPDASQPSQEEVVPDKGKRTSKVKKTKPRKRIKGIFETGSTSRTKKDEHDDTTEKDEHDDTIEKDEQDDPIEGDPMQETEVGHEEQFEEGMLEEKNKVCKCEDSSSEGSFNSSDERMALSSCDEEEFQFPEFNEMTDMDDPHFELGMLFTSGKTFRAAVRKHAIVQQRPIRLKKNLADKIKWICSGGCAWKCYGIKLQRSESIQIKTLDMNHTCNPTWEQKCVNSTWLATEYEDEIRMNPTWATQAFHSRVVNDLKCKISLSMIYRALKKAKDNILGKHEMEYAKVFAYANEIKKQMPTSTVKIMSEPAVQGGTTMRFKRFYVCLGPLKEGFVDGCRPLIGLDGCHLRGPLGGILLTAVATDPNDGMYPLAWAQVEAENNDSWEWFIRLLKDDLRMNNTGSYTFISDRQKGLVNALESQVPAAEHRFCVMHLYKNLWKEHKGIGVRRLLWSAAKSTTDYHYKMNMGALKKVFFF